MSCLKVSELIEESRSRKLSIKEALTLKLHVTMCPGCKGYKKLSNQLEGFIQESVAQDAEQVDIKLSDDQKRRLIEKLKNI